MTLPRIRYVRVRGIFVLTLLFAGCTRSLQHLAQSSLDFPPQMVMENGNYAGFLAENKRRLEKCGVGMGCDVALFNLGFIHAYSQSPYHDPAKALQYFGELLKKYPHSPWAFQGQVWIALINENLALDETRRRLQADLRTREATIRSLQKRLNRSRDIDIEMEKKERELLR